MKSLKQWCEENKEYEELRFYENAQNKIESDKIGFSSPQKVNWKCEKCGMEWKATPNKMSARPKKDCPFCMHRKPSEFYNLLTECPILIEEWYYQKNSKKPTEYLPNSKKKVWWKCKNGHVWESIISDRVRATERNIRAGKPICPYCNHRRVSTTYNLLTEFPHIARQWNYLKNGSLTPMEVSPKTNKNVWWICDYNPNHIWKDRISNRTVLNRECPICSKRFTISFPARAIFYYLRQSFNDCEIEYKITGKYILDVCLPLQKIALEYDGWYYHSSKEALEREKRKDEYLRGLGYQIIRVKEQKEESDKIEVQGNVLKYHLGENYKNLDKMIQKLIPFIGVKTNSVLNIDINTNRDYIQIENLYYHIRKANSLAVKQPELSQQWSKQNAETPDMFRVTSSYNALWDCPKCNKTYNATIYNRVKNKSNCPYCSNRKVSENNSLAKLCPKVSAQWNDDKNGELKPEDVTKGSDKMVWWKCEKGHEWQARVYARTGKHQSGCPYCRKLLLDKNNSLKRKGS